MTDKKKNLEEKKDKSPMMIAPHAYEDYTSSSAIVNAGIGLVLLLGGAAIIRYCTDIELHPNPSKNSLTKTPALLSDTLSSKKETYIFTKEDSIKAQNSIHPDTLFMEEYDANNH